ncbi:acyl-CoA N-acyltransferase [Dioszegia hungarica]|uniref:Acyl-CoA N-acyltransferase n=1 Tax=Dioszegia hungarica TaxID=4972 RepID=A0AA38HB49_9TREE|nr:acyl-CoA N-acyltransferase [Dioszegia hungarica]KAI9636304.1 acyl-CoA N-acyltransferase [Dioszegia hungarica]
MSPSSFLYTKAADVVLTDLQPAQVVLARVTSPTDEQLEAILRVMIKGYETGMYLTSITTCNPSDGVPEPWANRFPVPQDVKPEQWYRAYHMAWLGPALLEGQVWTARESAEGEILGVGIWSLPGCTLGSTPEQRAFGEAYNALIPPEQAAAQAEAQKGVVAERKALFPTLWKDTFHLHNLVTVPAARGKGVGGALMEEMIRQAHEQGAGMSLCTPTESNRRFYQRHGFETIWEREILYTVGEKEPYIVMTRDVKQPAQ